MIFSLHRHSKEPIAQCSICGRSVTIELSKTDEGGKAVHESCYVRRTVADFRRQIDEQAKSWLPTTIISPAGIRSEPALAGIPWRIFGLIRP